MKIIPEPLMFEWDEGNSDKNLKKHNVTNQESEQVFINTPHFLFEDEKHSTKEKRYMTWGITDTERKLTIFFTLRKDKVRIISARDMHKKERREYEKKIKTNTSV